MGIYMYLVHLCIFSHSQCSLVCALVQQINAVFFVPFHFEFFV